MIVNDIDGSWEIFYQRNHALIAGKIAMEIREDLRPPFWVDTFAAIINHDDGQNDFGSGEHITKEGHPKGFRAYKFHLKQAERVVNIGKHKGKWVFLMVSLHAYALRKDVKPKIPELKKFLDQQKKHHAELIDFFEITEKQAWHYYSFLRWCDELSLILCENRIGEKNKMVSIGKLLDIADVKIHCVSENVLEVTPWPFRSEKFAISGETRCLDKRVFKSSKELKRVLNDCEVTPKTWHLQKA